MKKSVLVIDDERDFCEVISKALRMKGYEVDCAFNLTEAAEKLRIRPDIVLLDNSLPDGTGIEYIQMHPVYFMQSFVVMISSDTDITLQKKAAYEGVQGFLPKPFSVTRMTDMIKTWPVN